MLKNSNYKKYLIKEILFYVALLFSTGSFVQSFMLAKGISTHLVATYGSIIQIAQTSVMILSSFLCDKMTKVIKASAILTFILPTLFFGFLIVQTPEIWGNKAYVIILLTSLITNSALGFYNILYYKLPYCAIEIKDFGKLSAITSIFSGTFSIIMTTAVSFLVNYVDFFLLSFITFAISAILWIISAIITATIKDNGYLDEIENNVYKQKINLLKYPYFYRLIPANLLRGICTGIITQMVVIGTHIGTLNTNLSVAITAITCLSTVIGSFVYIYLEKKFNLSIALTISAGLLVVTMPLSILFGVIPLYVLYFLSYIIVHIVANIMPMIIYKYVPYNIMAKYTAWRMFLFIFGSALPGFFLTPLLNSAGAVVVMLIGGIAMFISCLSYLLVFRKGTPVDNK